MSIRSTLAAAAAVLVLAAPLAAQQEQMKQMQPKDKKESKEHMQAMHEEMKPDMAAMMQAWQAAATPGAPQQELAAMAGTWKMHVTSWMEPGAPPQVSEATSTRLMILGGRYLEEKVTGTMMDQPFEGRGLTGYDNVKGKYWSTWIDNMSTGVMNSVGEKEPSGKLVLHGTYTDAVTKEPMKTKTVMWNEGPNKQVMEMWEHRGGDMVKTMEIVAERQ
jgi:Protein of unknown function (DUF1579)